MTAADYAPTDAIQRDLASAENDVRFAENLLTRANAGILPMVEANLSVARDRVAVCSERLRAAKETT